MRIIGEENIEAEVNKIAEGLDLDSKHALWELLMYYNTHKRDASFLQDSLTRERESSQKLLISGIKGMFNV